MTDGTNMFPPSSKLHLSLPFWLGLCCRVGLAPPRTLHSSTPLPSHFWWQLAAFSHFLFSQPQLRKSLALHSALKCDAMLLFSLSRVYSTCSWPTTRFSDAFLPLRHRRCPCTLNEPVERALFRGEAVNFSTWGGGVQCTLHFYAHEKRARADCKLFSLPRTKGKRRHRRCGIYYATIFTRHFDLGAF